MDAATELGGLDPYKALRLDVGASKEAIGKAARKLGLKYHPDKNTTDPEAPALFLQVQKAKEFLLDDAKRKAYDETRAATAKRKQYDEDRSSTMDEKRKRFRDDLEDKLRQAATPAGASSSSSSANAPTGGAAATAPSKKAAAHDLKEVNRLRQENLARMDHTAREQQSKREPARPAATATPEPPAVVVAPISAASLQSKETDVLQRMLEAARKKKAAAAAAAAGAAAAAAPEQGEAR